MICPKVSEPNNKALPHKRYCGFLLSKIPQILNVGIPTLNFKGANSHL